MTDRPLQWPAWATHFLSTGRHPDHEGPGARLYRFTSRETRRFQELSGEFAGVLMSDAIEEEIDWVGVDSGDLDAREALSCRTLDEDEYLDFAGMLFWLRNRDAEGEVVFRKITDVLDFRLVRVADKILSKEDHVDGGPFDGYERMHLYDTVEQALDESSAFSVDGPLEEVECSVCPGEDVARRLTWKLDNEAFEFPVNGEMWRHDPFAMIERRPVSPDVVADRLRMVSVARDADRELFAERRQDIWHLAVRRSSERTGGGRELGVLAEYHWTRLKAARAFVALRKGRKSPEAEDLGLSLDARGDLVLTLAGRDFVLSADMVSALVWDAHCLSTIRRTVRSHNGQYPVVLNDASEEKRLVCPNRSVAEGLRFDVERCAWWSDSTYVSTFFTWQKYRGRSKRRDNLAAWLVSALRDGRPGADGERPDLGSRESQARLFGEPLFTERAGRPVRRLDEIVGRTLAGLSRVQLAQLDALTSRDGRAGVHGLALLRGDIGLAAYVDAIAPGLDHWSPDAQAIAQHACVVLGFGNDVQSHGLR